VTTCACGTFERLLAVARLRQTAGQHCHHRWLRPLRLQIKEGEWAAQGGQSTHQHAHPPTWRNHRHRVTCMPYAQLHVYGRAHEGREMDDINPQARQTAGPCLVHSTLPGCHARTPARKIKTSFANASCGILPPGSTPSPSTASKNSSEAMRSRVPDDVIA